MRASITPFWQRIPSFFLYPLLPPALWLLLGITVAVALLLPTLDALLSVPLVLLLAVLLFIYGYESLDATAHGNAVPPAINDVFRGAGWSLPLKQIGVLSVFGAFVASGGALAGNVGTLTVSVLVQVLLPASVMVLGVERSFMAAVNPVHLSDRVRAIGWPYLGLLGLLFAQEIALFSAVMAVAAVVPESTLPLVVGWALVGSYFILMYFHMLGYVVYQYHEELGYTVHVDVDDDAGMLDQELALYDSLVADGRYEAALVELRSVLEAHPDDSMLHERLFRLAGLSGDTAERSRQADWLVDHWIRKGRVGDAVRIHLECVREQPDFRPERAEHHEILARELRSRGEIREALRLLAGLHKRFPRHAAVPSAYLLAAEIFMDEAGKPDQARRLLDYVRRHFPDDPARARADALLRVLEANVGAAQGMSRP